MDREGLVRAARRRQALDALTFEREREAMLVEALQDVLAEVDGPGLDAELLGQLDAADAELVRAALGHETPDDDDDAAGEEDDAEPDELEHDLEGEVARLRDEIETSQRVQTVLERYLELLVEPRSPDA